MSAVHAGMASAFPRVIHGVGDEGDTPHAPQPPHRDQQRPFVAASSPTRHIHRTGDAGQDGEGITAIRRDDADLHSEDWQRSNCREAVAEAEGPSLLERTPRRLQKKLPPPKGRQP